MKSTVLLMLGRNIRKATGSPQLNKILWTLGSPGITYLGCKQTPLKRKGFINRIVIKNLKSPVFLLEYVLLNPIGFLRKLSKFWLCLFCACWSCIELFFPNRWQHHEKASTVHSSPSEQPLASDGVQFAFMVLHANSGLASQFPHVKEARAISDK